MRRHLKEIQAGTGGGGGHPSIQHCSGRWNESTLSIPAPRLGSQQSYVFTQNGRRFDFRWLVDETLKGGFNKVGRTLAATSYINRVLRLHGTQIAGLLQLSLWSVKVPTRTSKKWFSESTADEDTNTNTDSDALLENQVEETGIAGGGGYVRRAEHANESEGEGSDLTDRDPDQVIRQRRKDDKRKKDAERAKDAEREKANAQANRMCALSHQMTGTRTESLPYGENIVERLFDFHMKNPTLSKYTAEMSHMEMGTPIMEHVCQFFEVPKATEVASGNGVNNSTGASKLRYRSNDNDPPVIGFNKLALQYAVDLEAESSVGMYGVEGVWQHVDKELASNTFVATRGVGRGEPDHTPASYQLSLIYKLMKTYQHCFADCVPKDGRHYTLPIESPADHNLLMNIKVEYVARSPMTEEERIAQDAARNSIVPAYSGFLTGGKTSEDDVRQLQDTMRDERQKHLDDPDGGDPWECMARDALDSVGLLDLKDGTEDDAAGNSPAGNTHKYSFALEMLREMRNGRMLTAAQMADPANFDKSNSLTALPTADANGNVNMTEAEMTEVQKTERCVRMGTIHTKEELNEIIGGERNLLTRGT